MYFVDLYSKYRGDHFNIGLEGAFVGGKISTGLALDAIPFSSFSSSGSGAGIIQLPASQTVQAILVGLEADGHVDSAGDWSVKTGYASGDETPLSTKITQYGFRPDYKIAMMLFDRPLGTSPSLYGGSASNPATNSKLTGGAPITGNFINNALYFALGYMHPFDIKDDIPQADWLKAGISVATAWAPKRNVALDFGTLLSNTNLPNVSDTASSFFNRWYGAEIDLKTEASFFENLLTSFDFGVLIPGRAYYIDVTAIDPGNIIDPIPVDKASPAIAARFTTMVTF